MAWARSSDSMGGGGETAGATWSTGTEAWANSNVGGDVAGARSWSASVR